MKKLHSAKIALTMFVFIFLSSLVQAAGQSYGDDQDPNKAILKKGLLGAGVGAISASASGGKAGTGALVGAGTNVIGGALLDTLSTPSGSQQQQPVQYVQQAPQPYYQQQAQPSYPVQTQQQGYYEPRPVYVQQQAPPRQSQSTNILKQGLMGAAVGGISAGASGGKAGKGALIGAGTSVIGSALLETLSGGGQQQQAPQPVYYQQAPQQQSYDYPSSNQPKKKIIRKYDSDGNVVSEEEVYE